MALSTPFASSHRKSTSYHMLLIILIAGALILIPRISSAGWLTETVDSSGYTGYYTSVATDSSGNVHIIYYDSTANFMKHATNASGSWVTETVSAVTSSSFSTSIAIDSRDVMHVSFYDAEYDDLKYATNASGSWVTVTVDSEGNVGTYSSIAVDSSDHVYISYYDSSNTALKYATNSSGTWSIGTMDNSGQVGAYSSIAIDSGDNTHICYYDDSIDALKYMTNASGSWVTEVLDAPGSRGIYSSIAIDSSDNVHISYQDLLRRDLKYVSNRSGSWVHETVDSDVYGGEYSDITIDSFNNVHISYYDYSNRELKYATNVAGRWVLETVDDSLRVGMYSAIAADPSGRVHISYHDFDYYNYDLKYATVELTACTDSDGDGYGINYGGTSFCRPERVAADCDDTDQAINPGSQEIPYDGIDQDCTGADLTDVDGDGHDGSAVGGDDCDDNDDAEYPGRRWYADADGDRYSSGTVIVQCERLTGYKTDSELLSESLDCNDNDSSIYPGRYDIAYDGIDQDCSGSDRTDVDGDGYDSVDVGGDDCKDNSAGINPETYWYADADGDGYGNPSLSLQQCEAPDGYVLDNTDCDDTDPAINPSLPGCAYLADNGWEILLLDNSAYYARSSIAADSAGKVHIVYYSYDSSYYNLKYMTNASGSWVTETLESAVSGGYPSIAIDSSDKVHISFPDGTADGLKYITNMSGAWVTQVLDSFDWNGGYSSIAVDPSDYVHISYSDDYADDLKYATNASGSWVTVTVDSEGNVGRNSSIAVDSAGNAYISYYDYSNDALKYATNSSGSWTMGTMASGAGFYSDIAVDSAGNAHIAFYSSRALKYMTNAPGSWTTETVENGETAGYYVALALDSSDRIHISSYDYRSDDLKYATKVSGSWVTETVDSHYDVGEYTSIAIDSLHNIHISYYDYSYRDLMYATKKLVTCTDSDGDGYGSSAAGTDVCFPGEADTDCDDADPTSHPGGTDIPYDGTDQDCSGADLTDVDADGYDSPAVGGDDCDDNNAAVHPATYWYEDADGDGYGNALVSVQQCEQPLGYVLDGTDIDENPAANTAIDLSLAPDGIGLMHIDSGLPSIENSELTVEAWVKRKSTSPLSGAIFSMYDVGGVMMWVNDNKPKFGIRANNIYPTSTDYMVSAGTSLLKNLWNHIAGVLVNESHTHPLSPSCTPGVMAETPHMDIYVNGVFEDCATTWGGHDDPARGPQFASDPKFSFGSLVFGRFENSPPSDDVDGLDEEARFEGVIDEVRLWTVARTEAEIRQCMDQELGPNGTCGRDNPALKGYWRFAEGTGTGFADHSGSGSTGTIQAPPGIFWGGGWVAGYPFPNVDSDGDGIPDNGDGTYIVGDTPCTSGSTSNCDDNCINTVNAGQTDDDGDGFGNACDCAGTDPSINPGAEDLPYDGTDQDCSGTDLTDVDGDGYDSVAAGGDDCDDNETYFNPLTYWYEDFDGDGYGNASVSLQQCAQPAGYVTDATDCDDADGAVNPASTEEPYNGKDDDCNAATLEDDLDSDGYLISSDCDDDDPSVNPGMDEVELNCKDDDCNLLTHDSTVENSWKLECVDNSRVDNDTSLAIDSGDNIHIGYYVSYPDYDLRYATNAGGPWEAETVASDGSIGGYASIATDASDNLHISYQDATGDLLKYATNASGSWVSETVDIGSDYGYKYTSIAIDPAGYVHIAYYDSYNNDLKYATNMTGSWVTRIIDSTGDTGMSPSISVDSGGHAHISYYYYGSYRNTYLRYATNKSGAWAWQTLDSSDRSYESSIASDPSGKVHISYRNYNNDGGSWVNELKYLTNRSGGWMKTTLDSGRAGYSSSIALDPSGAVHISYHDYDDGLEYATNASGSWVISTVDSTRGYTSSIGIDSQGHIHISYRAGYSALRYATTASYVSCTDSDGDGYGSSPAGDSTCIFGREASDCNDSDSAIHPNADEIAYDGIDQDCDGVDLTDVDEDGFDSDIVGGTDCNDGDAAINPDTFWYGDTDSDGYGDRTVLLQQCTQPAGYVLDSTDCNDGESSINPGLPEIPYNGQNDDCNASTPDDDLDGDGYPIASDCDDNSSAVNPGTAEITGNCRDDDCNAATHDGSVQNGWLLECVDSTGNTGLHTSVATDSAGNVHISYYNETHSSLNYMTNASGTWEGRVIDGAGDAGKYSSIALDSANRAHISYYDATNGNLRYATNSSGLWTVQTVDSVGDMGMYSSIALDSADNAYISYYDRTNGNLRYAVNSSGSWMKGTMDSAGDVGLYTSIAVDSNDRTHISYYDATNGDLKYESNASGRWVITVVNSAVDVGMYSSLALDALNYAYISYYDNTSGDYKYATNLSGRWLMGTMDRTGDVGVTTAIAMDSAGRTHISYYDATNGDLKYETNVTGPLRIHVLDAEGDVGKYSDMAIDASDDIYITYYDATNGDLYYATNDIYVPCTDSDGDGYGSSSSGSDECIFDRTVSDCNDADPAINPAAEEICDSIDNDCDGETDEFADADGDGYTVCTGDCDDTDAFLNPDTTWYEDDDGDGYGNALVSVQQCTQPAGFVLDDTDTDHNRSVNQAIDLSRALSGSVQMAVRDSGNGGFPSVAGTELTIEAWIKPKPTSTAGIVSMYDEDSGIVAWLKNNLPFFGIKNSDGSEYKVSGLTAIAQDTWTHIAGVLVNEAHSHPVTESCTAAVMAEMPHLDIYVNGVFENCASTGGHFASDPGSGELLIGRLMGGIDPPAESLYWVYEYNAFRGVIDEVRLWTTARSASEIRECRAVELGLSGSCSRDNAHLKGYWRFTEGSGSSFADYSGNGLDGAVEIGTYSRYTFNPWSEGWAPGFVFSNIDSDGDGIHDNADGSGIVGDNPCLTGSTVGCDDNCTYVANPGQSDGDADGYGSACDCDDADSSSNPSGTETPYDGVDQDCSGADLTDVDGDGYDSTVVGGDDCDDNDAFFNPETLWYQDSDNDGQGSPAASFQQCTQPAGYLLDDSDCDDTDASVYYRAPEICDGQSNDCSNLSKPDGSEESWYEETTYCGIGACSNTGRFECTAGVQTDTCTVNSPTGDDSDCDDIDDDCDGATDEHYVTTTITCGEGSCLAAGQRECRGGWEVDVCTPLATEDPEVTCDDLADNDCDGAVDADDTDCDPTSNYALDFSLSSQQSAAYIPTGSGNPLPDLTMSGGRQFTVEAWVKRGSSALTGALFGRLDSGGFVLYMDESRPRFAVRSRSTSTLQFVVRDDREIEQNRWTHIAGSLTEEDQSSGPGQCGRFGDLIPHLAIYVNGDLIDCRRSMYADNPLTSDVMTIGVLGSGTIASVGPVSTGTRLNGIVDEVRYWSTARTESQIKECLTTELGLSGNCDRSSPDLVGYWRLNEGAGSTLSDLSLNGYAGSVESPRYTLWGGGWVDGYPFGLDTDGDGLIDGGGVPPCTGGETTGCVDNCVDVVNPGQEDSDGDSVGDVCDNCIEVANPDQRDSNADDDDNTSVSGEQHYGNVCDADFDNNGVTDMGDFNVLRGYYRQSVPPAPDYVDLDGDGLVGLEDINIFNEYYQYAPGPGIGD